MGERLRLGIVGCGGIAGIMAMVARITPSVRLVVCCDADRERSASFARRHRIPKACAGLDEMLALNEVDALYLAVPHDLHAGMIASAMAAGKPVLVEKPLARTLQEGMRVAAAARERGAKVGVNYQYRYSVGCYALARAVRAGVLGRIHSARINVPWHRDARYFDGAPWHSTVARAGGGTLITQGSHLLDAVLWMLRERSVAATGFTVIHGFDVEVETLAQAIVQTEGGALVQISSSMIAMPEQPVSIEIYGERGTAGYSNKPFSRVWSRGVRVRAVRPPSRGVHALQRSLAGFAAWVLRDEPFLVPAREALPVLAAVDAIYRSARSGVREAVGDTKEEDGW